MAATFQPADALVYCKSFLGAMPFERVGVSILDEINKLMWMAAPWRYTLGALEVVTLLSSTQDYPITIPADFLFLFDGVIADGGNTVRNLQTVAALPANVKVVGNPSQISIEDIDPEELEGILRTFPKSGTVPTAPDPLQQFIIRYKKVAPTVTNETQYEDGFLQMDDEWFPVYQNGVLWKAYQWGNDSRAGSANFSNGQAQYSGQYGLFRDMLNYMAEREKLPLMEPNDLINPKAKK